LKTEQNETMDAVSCRVKRYDTKAGNI
jgi:hypothetical protein